MPVLATVSLLEGQTFSSDIFCYSQTKCLCPEWASSFSVFAYSAMNAYALESIGVYGYSPSCNHFCPLPNKRRCQFWRPSHYWKDRLFLPTSSVTHRQNAYAPSGHPLSAFSLIQRGMLMPLTGIGCLCQRHLFIEHFTFPDPCRDHPADGISMGKVIIILTLRQGDIFHTVTSPGCQTETLRTGIRLDSGDIFYNTSALQTFLSGIFGYSLTLPQADTSHRGDFYPPQTPACHQSSSVVDD